MQGSRKRGTSEPDTLSRRRLVPELRQEAVSFLHGSSGLENTADQSASLPWNDLSHGT